MKFSKFFSNIQETHWYHEFLNPVIFEISANSQVLDIGTGSGKLIQILLEEKKIIGTGVDTNVNMLEEAAIKLEGSATTLIKIQPNTKLPFEDSSFDFITICSVLFHLDHENIILMLSDAQRLLKKNGKIIVLTPTGRGNNISLSRRYFSIRNLSIYIWYNATKNKAKSWMNKNQLQSYASNNNLKYKSSLVMNGFAQLEILE